MCVTVLLCRRLRVSTVGEKERGRAHTHAHAHAHTHTHTHTLTHTKTHTLTKTHTHTHNKQGRGFSPSPRSATHRSLLFAKGAAYSRLQRLLRGYFAMKGGERPKGEGRRRGHDKRPRPSLSLEQTQRTRNSTHSTTDNTQTHTHTSTRTHTHTHRAGKQRKKEKRRGQRANCIQIFAVSFRLLSNASAVGPTPPAVSPAQRLQRSAMPNALRLRPSRLKSRSTRGPPVAHT